MTQQETMIFCTLFDCNYLDKGLVLYKSMRKHMKEFKLYVFAFDDRCYKILQKIQPLNMILISVSDIMTDRLQQIKKDRTRAEFCWTCTPIIIEHVLQKYGEVVCTYIDADIYFFANPQSLIQDIIDERCSVGLVRHGFERNWEYGKNIFSVGKYCIQFNTFLNNKEGIQVLEDWKESCLEWCYCRYEDGRFGDQKYPDKWKQKYSCIYECKNLGAGVAPWNLHLYSCLRKKNGKVFLKYMRRQFRLVFYHFEGMKYLSDTEIYLNLWKPDVWGTNRKVKVLYREYFKMIALIRKFLAERYHVTFEHMTVNKQLFFGENYSLKCFCLENGLFNGIIKWIGWRINNIIRVDKLLGKQGI